MENQPIRKRTAIGKQIVNIETSATKAKVIAVTIKEQLLSGTRDENLKAIAFLKKMEKICKLLLEDKKIKDLIMENVQSFTAEGLKSIIGVKIGMGASTRYDYLSSGHTEYIEIIDLIKQLTSRKKEIEELLKTIPVAGSMNIVIRQLPKLSTENNGELIEVTAPVKITKPHPKFTTS